MPLSKYNKFPLKPINLVKIFDMRKVQPAWEAMRCAACSARGLGLVGEKGGEKGSEGLNNHQPSI
jgi:hypothetical protein